MRCVICENSNWENVDQYRITKSGMALCNSCGFVSYPEKYTNKEQVIEHYRHSYRSAPTVDNLYTGSRKLHYHAEFLEDLVKSWSKAGKKDPVITDVGAAYGLFLAWWKKLQHPETGEQLFPKADLNGVELTLTYRRNAYHEFGLDLKEDFDDSKQYDLITSYKVAEHIYDIDVELKRYYDALKDDGKLYISVPTWFKSLYNFGAEGGYDIEYYYHPDHCNVWHERHFRYLLQKCGFAIEKENHTMYDAAYLCRKLKEGESIEEIKLLSVDEIKHRLEAIKTATDLFLSKKYAEALNEYPNFPIAWRAYYETNRAEFHKKGFEWIENNIIKKLFEIDNENVEYYYLAADLYMRYAKYDAALAIIKKGLELRPKCSNFLANVGNCYRALAQGAQDPKMKTNYLTQAVKITRYMKDQQPQSFAQAVTWIYNDNAQIPMPSEMTPVQRKEPPLEETQKRA